MKDIIASVIIDSTNSSVNSNKSHLKAKLIQPIKLDPNKRHMIKLVSSKIPLVKYNITSALTNNTMRYSVNGGSNYSTITFGDGLYEVAQIDSTIKYNLVNNSHYETDATTGASVYPFSVGANTALSKGFFTINTSYTSTAYTNTIIDIGNNSTSTFYALLGFGTDERVLSGSLATEVISTNNVDIYDGQYNIRLVDLIETFSNGQSSDILHKNVFTGEANSYYFLPNETTINVEGLIREGLTSINEIEVRLEDRNGDLITLSDNSTDSDVFYQFYIY